MQKQNKLKLTEESLLLAICISALYIFYFSDALNKVLQFYDAPFDRVSIISRAAYEAIFIACTVLFINKTRLIFLSLFGLIFGLFLLGQFTFPDKGPTYSLMENISIFNKYFFTFIIYFAIYKLNSVPDKFDKLIRILENIFLFNSLAAITGFILQIDLLKTYYDIPYRSGFNGFIPVQNESTVFYFLSVSYFYYKHFILKDQSLRFYVILASALILGTKGIYLYLALLLFFHFIYHSNVKTKLIAMGLILLLAAGISWYLTTEHSKIALEYFISRIESKGWIYTLLSGRNVFIATKGAAVLDNWSWVNYLVGGQDQMNSLIEMDLIDLFLFMGIIGGGLYLSLFTFSLFRFNILKPYYFFFTLSFFLLAFWSGHFFASAINSLYLCLISMYFYGASLRQRSQ